MNEWKTIVDNGFDVPADRAMPELLAGLGEALRSPDPQVRDRQAYSILATWIGRGDVSEADMTGLGDEMAARFADPEVQARTFAPLILAVIVNRGVYRRAWADAFARWYPAETDLRGNDPELGWLHAVAHGADLLGEFGRHPEASPAAMLDLAAERLTARTEYVWRDMEDDRLGHAIAMTLTRPELDAGQATAWLAPVREALEARDRSGIEPYVSNALRTLRVVHLLADRGVRLDWRAEEAVRIPHAEAVREGVAATLATTARYAG